MYAELNGTRIWYETLGAGAPLMCLHGGPGLGDNRRYLRWLAPLADTCTIIAPDHRGCGRSDDAPDATYTHAQLAADADALRAHLGFERVALLGTSYGGFIALEYALRYPERLTHLILVDTAPSHHHHDAAKQNALASGLPGIDPAMLDRLFSGRIRDDDDFRACYAAIQPLYATNWDPVEGERRLHDIVFRYRTHNRMFGHELPRYDLRDRLGEIRVPTLVLCGRHDWITPVDQSELMAVRIPGARLVIFEHSGHGPMQEENERFIAVLRDFLHPA